jgi:hypothetical protein
VQESEGKKGGCRELLKSGGDERVFINAIPGGGDSHRAAKQNGVIQQGTYLTPCMEVSVNWRLKTAPLGAVFSVLSTTV